MYSLEFTNRYLKDLKLARKRHLPEEELDNVIKLLMAGKKLQPRHKDHALVGNYIGYRDCHIRPDWVLIYKIEKQKMVLLLLRTGTHSDLL